MQWSVKTGIQQFKVGLPSNWSHERWFNATLENRSVQFLSHRFGCSVTIKAAGNLVLEKNIDLRQIQVAGTAGELKVAVQGDVWQGPQTGLGLLRAEVMPWLPPELSAQSTAKATEFKLRSPMTGKVLRVMVANGDDVKKGDELMVVEAMKMENRITAAIDGTIEGLSLTEGINISSGQNLLKIVPLATKT